MLASVRVVGWRTVGDGGSSSPTTLTSGARLNVGQNAYSPDGRLKLAMQSDGNLVLYNKESGTALWSAGTKGGSFAVMQGDGNLVVYNTNGHAEWNSGTHGNSGASLALQNDGNMVIYRSDGVAVWSTGTSLPAPAPTAVSPIPTVTPTERFYPTTNGGGLGKYAIAIGVGAAALAGFVAWRFFFGRKRG